MKHDKKLLDTSKDRVRVDITFLSDGKAPARTDDIMLSHAEGAKLYKELTGITINPATGNKA